MTSLLRRILVGFDGSADASNAARVAIELAATVAGEVVAVAVVRAPAHAETVRDRTAAAAAEREHLGSALAAARQLAAVEGVVLVEEYTESERPGDVLVAYAAEHGFDLLVVGRQGTNAPLHPSAGPVTEYAVRHARCPVLVVGL